MEKLVNESNEMIKAKWKLRANLLRKADEQRAKEREDALNIVVEEYKQNYPAIAALSDDDSFIRESLKENFVYTPSEEALARIKAIEDQAYALLPNDIQTEMWSPDTCGCKLHRICKMIGDEYVCQTFDTKLCEAHEGLTHEEIHDVVKIENTSKNLIERELLKDETLTDVIPSEESQNLLGAGKLPPRKWKDGIKYNWSFIGTGKNRVLKVQVDGVELTKNQKNSIKLFSKDKFGKDKIEI